MIPRLEPMLAVASEAFDSDDHLYEVKWDGVRCLAAVEAGQVPTRPLRESLKISRQFVHQTLGY